LTPIQVAIPSSSINTAFKFPLTVALTLTRSGPVADGFPPDGPVKTVSMTISPRTYPQAGCQDPDIADDQVGGTVSIDFLELEKIYGYGPADLIVGNIGILAAGLGVGPRRDCHADRLDRSVRREAIGDRSGSRQGQRHRQRELERCVDAARRDRDLDRRQ